MVMVRGSVSFDLFLLANFNLTHNGMENWILIVSAQYQYQYARLLGSDVAALILILK